MLQIRNLTKIYVSKKGLQVKALKDISFDLGDKGLVFILGKSGSGKSTLLNLLGGIDNATSGEIIVDGQSNKRFSEKDYESYRNAYAGFVFQDYNLIDSYKVGENIGLALELQGKPSDKTVIESLMRKVDLVDDNGNTLYDRSTYELSGGQKQRVAIARALIKNPKMILADEPTGALDSKTGTQLYELLKELAKDKLVIVVSHDRENAEKFGDRIIELQDGSIISDTDCDKSVQYTDKAAKREELTQSKLPLKRSISMGVSSLKYKKFRLILSIILSTVTFIFFGFSLTAANVNETNIELNSLFATGQTMISIRSLYSVKDEKQFSDSQLDLIKSYNDNKIIVEYNTSAHWILYFHERFGNDAGITDNNPYVNLGTAPFRKLAELNPNTGCEDANLKPDSRFIDKALCRLPENENEIAITDLRADMFIRFGYKEDDGTVTNISSPDALVGKKLNDFTITGIYETDQNRSFLQKYDIDYYDINNDQYAKRILSSSNNTLISYGFVCEGFFAAKKSSTNIGACLVRLTGNTASDAAFLDRLRNSDNGTRPISIWTPFSEIIGSAGFITSMMIGPFMGMAATFAIFAALLMMNFLSVTIDARKREIGILRALGASRKNIIAICLSESLAIAIIDFILSLIGVFVVCAIFNQIYGLSIFVAGIFEIFMMFLLCFVVAIIVTILPIVKMTKKSPIDIINCK